MMVFQKKCIEPLGESKSDYDIFAMFADRLGIGDIFTMGGKDESSGSRTYFHASDLPKHITWEEFEKKGYFVVPFPKDHKSHPGHALVRRRPQEGHPRLGSASCRHRGPEGSADDHRQDRVRVEQPQRFEQGGVVDPERPVMGPQYIPSWEGHRTKELYGKYPLQMVSPHPRFSFHTMGDSKESWLNEVKDHRVLVDGHRYWVMRLNAKDAAARGIKEGDLIRAFNDRGAVILCAQVGERVPPGTVHSYESCADYLPLGEPGYSPDTSGCVNILAPKRYITPTSTAMANNSCLIQVEKWEGQQRTR